jgi:3-dehydroquinate synthase
MSFVAPGSFTPCVDRWGRFDQLLATTPPTFVIADAKVLALHRHVAHALRSIPHVALRAGERAKSLRTLEHVAAQALNVPRDALVLAVGGGTIGDLATVFAHLHKRGARLIHVPSTVLAAVDSSVGGKGALNLSQVKNALGVFHAPIEGWLCPELFTTLTPAQHREGQAEAWKMALTLDEQVFRTWRLAQPDLGSLIRTSRALKNAVCVKDPYEQLGLRAVLNFGHTFGHVLESLTRYRVRHGEAVALGMLCALDVGRELGVTADRIALDVEARLPLGRRPRARLARALGRATKAQIRQYLRGDKKGATADHTRFILLKKPGHWVAQNVAHRTWEALLARWAP